MTHPMRFGWKQALLLLGTTAAMLVAAEAVVRGFRLAPAFGAVREGQMAPSLDPELLWVNTPDALDHNELGLRGPMPEEEKTRRRILLLGDSVAYGFGLDLERTIGSRLAEQFERVGAPVEVLNGGVCGYDTLQEARWLEVHAPRLDPDQVVLFYCLNDPIRSVGADERMVRDALRFDQEAAWRQAMAAHRMAPATRWILERFHLPRLFPAWSGHGALEAAGEPQNAIELLEGKDLSVVEQGLDRIAAWKDASRRPVVVAIVPWLQALSENYPFRSHHQAVAALAAERGLPVVDLFDSLLHKRVTAGSQMHQDHDPIHPDQEGARLIARVVCEFLWQRWLGSER